MRDLVNTVGSSLPASSTSVPKKTRKRSDFPRNVAAALAMFFGTAGGLAVTGVHTQDIVDRACPAAWRETVGHILHQHGLVVGGALMTPSFVLLLRKLRKLGMLNERLDDGVNELEGQLRERRSTEDELRAQQSLIGTVLEELAKLRAGQETIISTQGVPVTAETLHLIQQGLIKVQVSANALGATNDEEQRASLVGKINQGIAGLHAIIDTALQAKPVVTPINEQVSPDVTPSPEGA